MTTLKIHTILYRAGLWITAILCAVMLALSACSLGKTDLLDPDSDDNPTHQGGGMPDPNSLRITVDHSVSVNEELLHNTKQMK